MTSASQLYADIIGEDDYDYYDDYDEYSEEEHSAGWNGDPQKPSLPAEKAEPATRKPRPVIPTFFCELCNSDIPQKQAQTHETSKRHRGAVFDQRVIANQQRAAQLAQETAEANSRYFKEAFCPTVREKVLSFLPPAQLLLMRLVCKEWNEYLTQPETWLEQSYLRDGIRLGSLANCYISPDFPLMNLAFCRVLNTSASVKRFLGDVESGRMWSIWKLQLEMDQLALLSEELRLALATTVGNCSGHTLYLTVKWSSSMELDFVLPKKQGPKALARARAEAEAKAAEVPSKVLKSFNQALFQVLADNRTVEEFYSEFYSRYDSGVHPLALLEHNKRIRLMDLSWEWFPRITMNCHTEVEKEALKKAHSFTFHHTHCTTLTISCCSGSSMDRRHTKFLMSALEDNTILEKLVLARLGLRGKGMKYVTRYLLANSTLKELDVSGNTQCFDLGALENNPSLEVLDISNVSLGEDLRKAQRRFRKNKSLLRLNMNHCFTRMEAGATLFSMLPSCITHLQAACVVSYQSAFDAYSFDDVRNKLPRLEELDISDSSFRTFQGINTLLTTTSLKSLRVFCSSRFPQEEDFFDIYGFQQNSTLTSCDHHETDDRRMTDLTRNELDHYIQRNSLARRGRRTKAAR